MNDNINDDIEVDLDLDDGLEVEVVDDTPEPDRGKPKAPEVAADDGGADEADLEGYSDSVKKRISKLKFEQHNERRAKEEAVRIREEAIRYAEKLRKENEELRKAYAAGETVMVDQTKARLESELAATKKAYKVAYEAGDSDALLAAQEKLTTLLNEQQRVAAYRPRGAEAVVPSQPQPQAQQQQVQVPKPDERAMKWAESNPWFMTDKAMTGYVMGIHETLIAEGVDPKSDLYYTKIDTAVRRTFPDKFDDVKVEEKASRRQAGPVVAPAARSTKAPRKVTLTSSEAALAKRLGVSLQEYAAQKLKDMQNG